MHDGTLMVRPLPTSDRREFIRRIGDMQYARSWLEDNFSQSLGCVFVNDVLNLTVQRICERIGEEPGAVLPALENDSVLEVLKQEILYHR